MVRERASAVKSEFELSNPRAERVMTRAAVPRGARMDWLTRSFLDDTEFEDLDLVGPCFQADACNRQHALSVDNHA